MIPGFEKALQNLPIAEKVRLTKATESYFKLTFEYHLEPGYNFTSIHKVFHPDCYKSNIPGRYLTESEKIELYNAFSSFVDDSVTKTYNEVEQKYGGHKPDENDKILDADGENAVFHYQLANNGLGRIARIHGYIKNGYFVVLRMDWCHSFHTKNNIKPSAA